MFGIKRIASRKFKQARTYSMDMEQLQTILNLGSFEQARTDRALNEYKVVRHRHRRSRAEGYQP